MHTTVRLSETGGEPSCRRGAADGYAAANASPVREPAQSGVRTTADRQHRAKSNLGGRIRERRHRRVVINEATTGAFRLNVDAAIAARPRVPLRAWLRDPFPLGADVRVLPRA